jgi:heme oxygenase
MPTPTLESDIVSEAPSVSAQLRQATASEHKQVETRSFVSDLMGGQLGLDAYAIYLAQLARVYLALEERAPDGDATSPLYSPALCRSSSIHADLVALGHPEWQDTVPCLPATIRYAMHLRNLGDNAALRHLAHHYTRYLGDLSGGQVIAAMLRRHYGASDSQLTFFAFDAIDNLVQFKRAYREALDGLVLSADELEILTSEAQLAFGLNSAVFDDLNGLR